MATNELTPFTVLQFLIHYFIYTRGKKRRDRRLLSPGHG